MWNLKKNYISSYAKELIYKIEIDPQTQKKILGSLKGKEGEEK